MGRVGHSLLPLLLAGACQASDGQERAWFDEDRVYQTSPDPGCNGTPENPGCVVTLELRRDGRLLRSFDDIVLRGDYWLEGGNVVMEVPDADWFAELELSADGEMLGEAFHRTR